MARIVLLYKILTIATTTARTSLKGNIACEGNIAGKPNSPEEWG